MKVVVKETKPFDGQKMGTSGLRKSVVTFQQANYTENFVQAILDCVGKKDTLVLGGDGRYYSKQIIQIILSMLPANGVKQVYVGVNGILSTPAVSALIRKLKADGGIILTASHNPGGPDGDFGIKYNVSNGGPAPEVVTDKIYPRSQSLTEYRIVDSLTVDISTIGCQRFNVQSVDGSMHEFVVNVIDSVDEYLNLMKSIFNFNSIKRYTDTHKVLVNCLNGVMGPYAKRVFVDELSCPLETVVNGVPLPDFGGKHPDPNLTYAKDLVDEMAKGTHDIGVAFDGDGDRNMILGKNGFFVCPSDSLAVLASHLQLIPYFEKNGVNGFARSMPTAGAVDRVAAALGKECHETPTGWKFFGNLMDAGRCSICGEESFGLGSDHIREKDGLWAMLAWLSILAETGESVEQLVTQHWDKYGRNFFTRYDYENCESGPCSEMMKQLEAKLATLPGCTFTADGKSYQVAQADNFSYVDPVDASVTEKQGLRIVFTDSSRVVFRLSGTGSTGATVRMYIDSYEADPETVKKDAASVLKPLIQVALELSQLPKFTGRDAPTVIT